ncbi:probable phytol kinase 1, chloroplastic [Cornus florida]|uniref:probable phytol kinase 1, chloroplastic n=1 Tax=Cornus florida TaxID=4283 RepID=UPI00289DE137|nr:probable phytol kinase 1, chloroplastic [Cornus florida]
MPTAVAILSLASPAATTTLLSFTRSPLSLLRQRAHPHSITFLSPTSPTPTSLISSTKRLLGPYNFRSSAAVAAFYGGAFLQDAGATAAVMVSAYGLVSVFDNLTQRNLIEQKLSRKLVHILSGLLFMASWPIFSTSTGARYFASFVPFINCLRLAIHGLSLATDEGLVKSVTREGNPEELLRGPLYYVLMLILCALVFWRESPIGVISLAMMCGGDGVADIMGRRFGSIKIPYNQNKSWAGSISMFAFGFLISMGMLYYFSVLGYFQMDWLCAMERVALVSFVATAVESLPTLGVVDDNITVPLASMATAYMTFGY